MKKTVQVNLSGQIFTLDDDAYELLSSYLHQIGAMYDRSPGKDEIIADIEARIAELLLERFVEGKQVVSIKDVEAIIEIMGRPEQFEAEEGFEENNSSHQNTGAGSNKTRRLHRDPDNTVVGGVCAGLGHYFGIDPVWVRLIFACAVIFAGSGVLLYIILWAVIPEAKTTADKLNMKGEPVNINNIGKSIEDELNAFGERLSGSKGKATQYGRKAANGIDRFFHALAEILKAIINALGKILGTAFLLVGLFSIVAILAAFFGVADFFHWGSDHWNNSMSIYEFGDMIFSSGDWFAAAIIGLIITVAIPFIALAYGGFCLLFPAYRVPYLGASLLAVWFIGLAVLLFTAFGVGREFSKEDAIKVHYELSDSTLNSNVVIIDLGSDPFNISDHRSYSDNRNDFMMKAVNDQIYFGNISFTVEKSQNDETYLEVFKSAQGRSFEDAREKSERIMYKAIVDSNRIILDAFYSFPLTDLIRDQDVRVVLRLAEGKSVFLTEQSKRVIDDIENVQDIYDPDMVNHTWKMTSRGLSCEDCFDEDGKPLGDIQRVDGYDFDAKVVIQNQ